MKIVDVEALGLSVPLEQPVFFATRAVKEREFTVTRIFTDEGIVGISCVPIGDPGSVVAIIERKFKPLLIGQDPFDVERLWTRMYHEMYRDRKGAAVRAISAVDIALWDIKGKAFEKPLYKLLGGYRDQVPCYASGGYYRGGDELRDLAKEMEFYLEHGFTAVKIKIGALPLKKDLERVKIARSVLGPDVVLMVDANNAYDVATAIRVGRALEELDVFFFEEPVKPDDFLGSQRVAETLDIPIASGELEYTVDGFRDLIISKAVDIIQPDATVLGGITEWIKVAGLAKAFHIPISPHWEQEVHMHLVGAFPNTLWVEFFMKEIGVRVEDKLYKDFVLPKDGMLAIPDKPGLGVELDADAIKRYRIL